MATITARLQLGKPHPYNNGICHGYNAIELYENSNVHWVAQTRQGKVVVVQHRAIEDPDHGGSFTIKLYRSEKVEEYGEFVNQRIVLKPQTNAFDYKDIVLEDELEDLKVIGEFLSVL